MSPPSEQLFSFSLLGDSTRVRYWNYFLACCQSPIMRPPPIKLCRIKRRIKEGNEKIDRPKANEFRHI